MRGNKGFSRNSVPIYSRRTDRTELPRQLALGIAKRAYYLFSDSMPAFLFQYKARIRRAKPAQGAPPRLPPPLLFYKRALGDNNIPGILGGEVEVSAFVNPVGGLCEALVGVACFIVAVKYKIFRVPSG